MPLKFRFIGPALLISGSLLLNSCGGRAISKKTARDVIINSPAEVFDKEDVDIISVSQVGARNAVAEAYLRSAFKLEKVGGKWIIREVRVGNHQWEKLDDILEALRKTKIEETRQTLEQVGVAVEAYRLKNGHLPTFDNYQDLSDMLYPLYMSPLVREDAWHSPLVAYRLNADTIRFVSAGPDGKLGTEDDIELTRTFPAEA